VAGNLSALLALMPGHSADAATALAPIIAGLGGNKTQPTLITTLTFAVTPVLAIIPGEFVFFLPADAMQLSALLSAPTLRPLLSASADVTVSVSLAFSVIYTVGPRPFTQALRLPTAGRRRRLQAAPAPAASLAPGTLAAVIKHLAGAGANVQVTQLLKRFQELSFATVSATVSGTGVTREALRKTVLLSAVEPSKNATNATEPSFVQLNFTEVLTAGLAKAVSLTFSTSASVTATLTPQPAGKM